MFTHDVELRRVRSCQLVKPTGWLSSSFHTSDRVAIRPRGGHVHQQLVNGMTNVTSESDLAVTHFDVGDTLGELARWVVATPREEAGFSDELTVHVPLHEGSRWAQSSQTEFYDDPTGFEFDADMVCRARDQEMRYLVGSLKVWISYCGADRYRWVASNRSPFARSTSTRAQTPLPNTDRRWWWLRQSSGRQPAPQDKAAVFPSTTPLEADRLLCSLATSTGAPTHTSAGHAEVVMVFLDTIRAHPHIEVARTLGTKLPEEHPVLSSLVRRHHTASRLCITVTIVSWLEHARMSRR